MMSLSEAAQALGCELIGDDIRFTAVASDSRTINAGDLFVALQGEHFDGTTFVADACKNGAAAALVSGESYRNIEPPCPLLLVEDTRLALGRLAAYWRSRFSIPMVAVTGSNGKTTVKEMLADVLRAATADDGAVLATLGNLNNDIGVPLTLLKLRAEHRYAVIEMGMNHAGEIEYLTGLTRPDIAIITNAGSAHLAGLGSVEAVARAKGEILTGLSSHGTAILNADDIHEPLWRGLVKERALIEFGLGSGAAVHAQWQEKNNGMHMEVRVPHDRFDVQMKVLGEHNVLNAMAATAAALALKVSLLAIKTGLEKFSGVAARLQFKDALHGATLIDDTYNANPASLYAALNVLTRRSGKKILVLGDMGELGDDGVRLHSEIGADIRRFGVGKLLALGKLTSHAVDAFGVGASHFERIEDLLGALDEDLDASSTVLVKGSRFMRMERVVQHCTKLNQSEERGGKKKDKVVTQAAPAFLSHPTAVDRGNNAT